MSHKFAIEKLILSSVDAHIVENFCSLEKSLSMFKQLSLRADTVDSKLTIEVMIETIQDEMSALYKAHTKCTLASDNTECASYVECMNKHIFDLIFSGEITAMKVNAVRSFLLHQYVV